MVTAWIVAEVALRIHVKRHRETFLGHYKVADPVLGWRLSPGYRSEMVTINDDGFRGDPIADTAAARIVMVGNSCVFGTTVGDSHTIPALLEKRLQGVDVINAGVPGYSVEHVRKHFERDIKPLKPDVLVVYAGWNDYFSYYPGDIQYARPENHWFNRALEYSYVLKGVTKFAFQTVRPKLARGNGDAELYRNYRPARFINAYRALIESARAANVRVVALTLPSLLYTGSREKMYYPFFTTNTDLMRILIERYNDEIKAMPAEVWDFAEVIAAIENSERLFEDTHHLNAEGNRIAADWLARRILQAGGS